MRRRVSFFVAGFLALCLLVLVGWVSLFGMAGKTKTMLSTQQLAALELTHWSPMEQWVFAQSRLSPGHEVRFAEFEGEGSRTITARFVHDMLDLGPDLDGGGVIGLNFVGAIILGDVDLSNRRLDYLRLVGTTVGGKLALNSAVVASGTSTIDPANLARLGDVILWDVTVGGVADFVDMQAENVAITGLEGARFALFSGVQAASLRISNSYGFDLVAALRASVEGDMVLRDIDIASHLVLQGLSASNLTFENMTVGGQFDGTGMVVDGDVVMAGLDVGQELVLSSSTFGGDLLATDLVRAQHALTDAIVGGETNIAIQRLAQ